MATLDIGIFCIRIAARLLHDSVWLCVGYAGVDTPLSCNSFPTMDGEATVVQLQAGSSAPSCYHTVLRHRRARAADGDFLHAALRKR